ncbi:tRNA uridine(34) 5-carboxymethylaminomethyl modification radical SAM/GNAT enzyme Elp3 [Methanonatronarchaeum sp. AMET-Sl]|uniref:tRNA uridine(34) 5-carboxymethylaminomethyl modification radical SAM/GNAT enzyme Elp3 n=1 Tax=Methanonatronarchaeum sp. AMET-Sl TaxID=3037654 RepID=UPI00244E2105|nr:tRNA uridine(34) 5-carboxymethylaminomethyl modification radical SAM/GNAT enzyme Elp3 [Methanonatronarchaeum sp. AMET-Sl]WGI17510.1 tRNA uridine(34) 5-carboxymethylaminomethyl modification radical SAM/GNAT enzyme Elp3 [Methanonatronarchaeum sp. AMET-Sl]
MDRFEETCREIARRIVEDGVPESEIESVKREVCRETGVSRFPSNPEILKYVDGEEERDKLKLKPTRSISGVNIIAVMTSPYKCPHGRCVPCPGGPENDSPQSYTGKEPAAMRAIREGYDPYSQVRTRVSQLKEIGHDDVEKVELIVMGGTAPAREGYIEDFVKNCFDGLNKKKSSSLMEAKSRNEDADIRCIGLTFETRPDYCKQHDIDRMLDMGCTRVELGVQTIYNDVYKKIERGHRVEDVYRATKQLKDSGLKVTYHMMLGLPGTTPYKDVQAFEEIFSDERLQPDALKIYPTQVVKGTELYEMYLDGDYRPLTNEETADLIARVKKKVPPHVRIMRVMRDIPSHQIDAGPDKTNLRQVGRKKLVEEGNPCRCIRCREVGHRERKDGVSPQDIELVSREYKASSGKEIFLSIEDVGQDILIGLLRLRILDEPFRPELNSGDALVRELHVYGEAAPIGREGDWQHHSYGEKLLKKAEERARELGAEELSVISGVGARNYYRKYGYNKKGVYMNKKL